MPNTLPSFPIPCLDIRHASYLRNSHYLVVLQGNWTAPERPIFASTETSSVVVGEQGWWGSYEWSLLPQLYDPMSPWLACIPIYLDAHHVTRSTIHRSMIVDAPRPDKSYNEKQAVALVPETKFKEHLKAHVDRVMEAAKLAREKVDSDTMEVWDPRIVWPTETVDRATFLERRLRAGLPSLNSFKRCLGSLRRAVLELEGFAIWVHFMQASRTESVELARTYKADRKMKLRGVFLDGSKESWLDGGSEVRRIYADLTAWSVPLYTLLKRDDWNMTPHASLPVGNVPFTVSAAMKGTPTCSSTRCMELTSLNRARRTPATILLLSAECSRISF